MSLDAVHFSGEAVAFWALVIGAIVLFSWSRYADGAMAKNSHDDLAALLDELRTLPSTRFMQTFKRTVHKSHKIALLAMAFADAPRFSAAERRREIDRAIRTILGNIVGLAKDFQPTKAVFGANVMLFSKNWDKVKLGRVLDVGHLSESSHIGTLEIFQSLSTTSLNPRSPDQKVPEIALPVHKSEPVHQGYTNILPGAPETFLTGRFYRCVSHENLFEHLSARYADKNQADALRRYFSTGEGQAIKSFVCIPIVKPQGNENASGQESESNFLGVLNIHSSESGLLPKGEELFWPVVSALVSLVAVLIESRP